MSTEMWAVTGFGLVEKAADDLTSKALELVEHFDGSAPGSEDAIELKKEFALVFDRYIHAMAKWEGVETGEERA